MEGKEKTVDKRALLWFEYGEEERAIERKGPHQKEEKMELGWFFNSTAKL